MKFATHTKDGRMTVTTVDANGLHVPCALVDGPIATARRVGFGGVSGVLYEPAVGDGSTLVYCVGRGQSAHDRITKPGPATYINEALAADWSVMVLEGPTPDDGWNVARDSDDVVALVAQDAGRGRLAWLGFSSGCGPALDAARVMWSGSVVLACGPAGWRDPRRVLLDGVDVTVLSARKDRVFAAGEVDAAARNMREAGAHVTVARFGSPRKAVHELPANLARYTMHRLGVARDEQPELPKGVDVVTL